MEGSESGSLTALSYRIMESRRPARSSFVSSVSSCATLFFKILNRSKRRVSKGGIGELFFGHTFPAVDVNRGREMKKKLSVINAERALVNTESLHSWYNPRANNGILYPNLCRIKLGAGKYLQ